MTSAVQSDTSPESVDDSSHTSIRLTPSLAFELSSSEVVVDSLMREERMVRPLRSERPFGLIGAEVETWWGGLVHCKYCSQNLKNETTVCEVLLDT